MMTPKDLVTRYVPDEGRAWVRECLGRAADWCLVESITTMVIFTGTGEGPYLAATETLVDARYQHLKVVAVTPPAGRPYKQDPSDVNSPIIRAGLSEAMREKLTSLGIRVVSAHLPFKEKWDGTQERTSEWTRVAEAFGVLGGGFALCVQAALVACDAGIVEHGARVVAVSADTALSLRTCRTESFLSPYEGLIVDHIICRPAKYHISKSLHEAIASPAPNGEVLETTGSSVVAPELPQTTPSARKSAQRRPSAGARSQGQPSRPRSGKARPKNRH